MEQLSFESPDGWKNNSSVEPDVSIGAAFDRGVPMALAADDTWKGQVEGFLKHGSNSLQACMTQLKKIDHAFGLGRIPAFTEQPCVCPMLDEEWIGKPIRAAGWKMEKAIKFLVAWV